MKEENFAKMNIALHNSNEYFDDTEEEAPYDDELIQPRERKRPDLKNGQLVVVLQIMLCVLVIAGIFILRLFGGTPYDGFKAWYAGELNKTVIASAVVEQAQGTVSQIAASVEDTAKNLGKKMLV